MPKKNTTCKAAETLKQDKVSRMNMPTAGYQPVMRKEERSPIPWPISGVTATWTRNWSGAGKTYWVPGVNNHGLYGRWAFAELTEVYQIEADFGAQVAAEFNKMLACK